MKPVDDRREQYCPNCSGVSPTGGYCAACLAMLIAAERGDNSSWLQEDSFTAFGRDDDDGDDAFVRDDDDENTSPSQLSLSGERVTRDLMPGATARPDAGVPGHPAPDPPPILPLSTPTVLADPVLRELLPSDPDTATRLLSDLTLIGDCLDAAAALRATGNVAQAQAAEQAAREVYDFWSVFYRDQERLALIAERLHELTVASIEAAEAGRVAGQAAAQALDDDAALEKSWNRANTDPVFQPAHPGADLASFGIARDPSTMTPQEQADYAARTYAPDDMGIYETTGRLARGLAGEKAATEFLASEGHQILQYKPDITGTNQGGFDMVTMHTTGCTSWTTRPIGARAISTRRPR